MLGSASTLWGNNVTTDNDPVQDSGNLSQHASPMYAEDLPGGCPPSDAKCEPAVFYAAHRDQPPSDFDFTTAWQRNVFPNATECERKSNSVMAREEDARHLLKLVPKRYRFVSRGAVTVQHGVWKHSGTNNFKSHHSLWVFRGVQMKDIFSVTV